MPRNVDTLVEKIEALNKRQSNYFTRSLADLSNREVEILEQYLEYCLSEGLSLDYLARSYNTVVNDTFKEELYFRRNRRYRFNKYEDVAELVYSNPEYMSRYMQGLALTLCLWPNQAKIRRFFEETIPKRKRGQYLEIGPGHGFFFMAAMQLTLYDAFHAVDVSLTSVEMTKRILKSNVFGKFENYNVYHGDFTQFNSFSKYDAIVMGEVLEHVEQPTTLLSKISDLSHEDTYIFISTCINAPAIDHIYLFESINHLEEIIRSSGLAIQRRATFPYVGLLLSECEERKLPINVALILSKCR